MCAYVEYKISGGKCSSEDCRTTVRPNFCEIPKFLAFNSFRISQFSTNGGYYLKFLTNTLPSFLFEMSFLPNWTVPWGKLWFHRKLYFFPLGVSMQNSIHRSNLYLNSLTLVEAKNLISFCLYVRTLSYHFVYMNTDWPIYQLAEICKLLYVSFCYRCTVR